MKAILLELGYVYPSTTADLTFDAATYTLYNGNVFDTAHFYIVLCLKGVEKQQLDARDPFP